MRRTQSGRSVSTARDGQLEHRGRRREWQRRDLQPQRRRPLRGLAHLSVQRMQQQEPNSDGAFPDEGLVVDGNKLIGIAIYGGNGSPAGYNNSGGTLYELTLDDF